MSQRTPWLWSLAKTVFSWKGDCIGALRVISRNTYAKYSSYKARSGKFRGNVPFATVPDRNCQIYLTVSSYRFRCTLDENKQKTRAEVKEKQVVLNLGQVQETSWLVLRNKRAWAHIQHKLRQNCRTTKLWLTKSAIRDGEERMNLRTDTFMRQRRHDGPPDTIFFQISEAVWFHLSGYMKSQIEGNILQDILC